MVIMIVAVLVLMLVGATPGSVWVRVRVVRNRLPGAKSQEVVKPEDIHEEAA
jgi:hypothetical protein